MDDKEVFNTFYEKKPPKMEIKVRIGWFDFIFDDPLKASVFMMTAEEFKSKDDREINITMEACFVDQEDNENEE